MGAGRGRVTTAERDTVDEQAIARVMQQDEELRQRLRACVLELVPNKWGIRGTLFRIIDRAPRSSILSMRERIRELVS
jgi:hypothetical protein